MLHILRRFAVRVAGTALGIVALGALSMPADAQGCGQGPVKGGSAAIGPLVNCQAPPIMKATPSTGTFTGKLLHIFVEYCSVDKNLDGSTVSTTWNGVEMADGYNFIIPDTLTTSGYCGTGIRLTSHTGQSDLNLTLKPGTNTLHAHICDDYAICADSTWTYTYTPIFPVAVTPDDSAARAFASQAGSQVFVVKRLDADTALGTYTLTKTCTGAAFSGSCTLSPSSVALRGGQSANATVSFTTVAGTTTGRIVVTAVLTTNGTMTDLGSVNLNSSPPGVNITPDNVAGNAAPSAPNTAFFTVVNTGPVTATFIFTTGCTGSTTGCVATPASQALAGGASFTATIRYTAGAVPTTGVVKLRGVHSTIPAAKDSGWVNITAAVPGAIVVASNGTGSTLERSLCLTVAAGHGAATECGDLRLAHALPAVRTKNKARVPTLLYNSAHAHPNPTFPFLLTLPASAPVPDSVTASLSIAGVTKANGKWTGADFNFARTRRAVLAFDALSDTSGVYLYSVQAKSWYGATPYASTVANGEYALVNRRSSNFGAGWWMAGLEQLMILGDGTLLWVEGDGTTRHYLATTISNTWTAANVERPDTLKLAGGFYTRYAEHGLRVIFDNIGNHVYTVNRVSDTTMFKYTVRRLDTIIVAPMSAAKKYAFTYDAATPNRLTSVTAPALPGKPRVTTITTSGGRITGIQEPDLTQVTFGYTASDTNRITSRTDRRGTVGTFTFNAQRKVVRDSIGMDAGDAPIVTNFRPYETVGVSPNSIDSALAYGLIDGPRTDVGDTTLFWLDPYGAPRKIRNALGADTKLFRADPNFPALVTRVQSPNGRVVLASYDTRGNVVSTTDSSSCVAAGCAVTTYQWDAKWDFVKKILAPLGEVTWMSYDASTGNRLWQQPDADTSNTARRVSFTYDATTKLLASVQEPIVAQPQRVWYDAMGNPDSTKSPTGIVSYFYKDALGRDTLAKSPADLTTSTWTWSRVAYNIADQDSVSVSWSPGHPDSIIVSKTFDTEGNVLNHTTKIWPDSNAIGSLQHLFTYDRANRKRWEQPQGPINGAEGFVFDAAGNVVTWTPRGMPNITTTYDALNRPVQRIVPSLGVGGLANYTFGTAVPADTQTFAYDVAGNMVQANNLYAKITRVWNQNGTLAADSERVRAAIAQDPSYPHSYGMRYGYDLEGRRLWMKYPGNVAPTGYDSVGYAYDATVGVLKSVRDIYGNRFAFGYDNALRLVTDTSLAGSASPAVNSRAYDDESRVTGQTMIYLSAERGSNTISYDQRSKVVGASYTVAGVSATPAMTYAPLGPMTGASDGGTFFNDAYNADALGNSRSRTHLGQTTDVTTSTYDPGTAILLKTVTVHNGAGLTDTTAYGYNLAGSVWTNTALREVKSTYPPYNGNAIYARTTTKTRYGADLKLMLSVTHFDSLNINVIRGPTTYEEVEEYRYDALGRRIWRRLVRPDALCPLMDKASGCLSTVERTIWDGDQVIAELRADGGQATTAAAMECDANCQLTRPSLEGRVLYVHGAGLDHPLDVIRLDWYTDVIVPVYSWRDRAVDGICVNGSQFCTQFAWPARTESATFEDPPSSDPTYGGPVAWGGNLMDTQKDGSGLVYKRNRYYDPTSGRFTQVDPIGLGGGLSAYGFGGGDQVSFSDPFGLCFEDACIGEALVGVVAVGMAATSAYFAWASGASLGHAIDRGIEDTRVTIGNAIAATVQAGHVKVAEGYMRSAETHLEQIDNLQPNDEDPSGKKSDWTKNARKALRVARKAAEKVVGKTGEKLLQRIKTLEGRLDKIEATQ